MTKNEFYRRWLKHFAANISQENIDQYVISTGNYLWHIFSWELLQETSYFKGEEAKTAYEMVDKQGALYIEWFKDETVKCVTRELHDVSVLNTMDEVYVVASDFSWTYIKTHEIMCGPYFMHV